MTSPVATFLSYRLGGADGVSVEATKWEWALTELGFATRRVAGELEGIRRDDTWLAFLAIDPPPGADVEPNALAAALAGSDLVVVENICSLPLNPTAASTAADVLRRHRGRVVFHHHDLPWERAHLAAVDGIPVVRDESLHVTISDHARLAMIERGFDAHTIRNSFDFTEHHGDRHRARASIGVAEDDILVLQPTRAIPRKEVGRGIAFAEDLQDLQQEHRVVYWLTGPAEDGYEAELEHILLAARVPVKRGRTADAADAYAAADVVIFPSSWEGFGNPVVEAAIARRPLVVARYPVLDELIALGLSVFSVEDPQRVANWLDAPDLGLLDRNIAALRPELDLATLPDRIDRLFTAVGWRDW
jgi:glycosyltransferase involved in cell wall biosynthesis